jgi:hypothetical protein
MTYSAGTECEELKNGGWIAWFSGKTETMLARGKTEHEARQTLLDAFVKTLELTK